MLFREKIGQSIYKLIKIIYVFFMLWTFLGAIRSTNLEINNVSGKIIALIILGVIIYGISKISIVVRIFKSIISKFNTLKIAVFLGVLVVILQLAFVMLVHPKIGFDVDTIHKAVLGDVDSNYFSHYTNNILIFLIQRYIYIMFHNPGWLLLDLITVFLVDIAAILNIFTLYVWNKKYVISGIYIHLIWLLLFPMIIVPYTDTWVLPFVSLFILMWQLISKESLNNSVVKIVCSVIMAASVVMAYFIKPSSIVPIIAITIVEIVRFVFEHKIKSVSVKKLGIAVLFCVAYICFFTVLKCKIDAQHYVHLEKHKATPAIYFVALGMSNTGAYNVEDATDMLLAKDTNEIKQISEQKIKDRLELRGPLGYIKFLLYKQNLNTSDGTFGWGKEGYFINQEMPQYGLEKIVSEYIYPGGKRVNDFYFIAQVWWIIWLFILLFGTKYQNDKMLHMLWLSVIGGMAFLLLFEGGRSRYLIQFLPVFLILATLQFENAKTKIKLLIVE